jgi:UDP-glucose 4-epimerase
MKKILVTGGSGFIGSHLSESLAKNNKVVILDKLIHGNKVENFKNIQFVKGDVRNLDLLRKLSKNCDIIYHLAAIIGVDVVSERNLETMEYEFEGLKNICICARENKISRIIYSSSSGVYGKLNYNRNVSENVTVAPVSAYAMAKRSGELYLQNFYSEFNISSIAVRLFNVYGPRQDKRMVIKRFIQNAIKNEPLLIYGNGNQTRDFTYIDDCIKVFKLLGSVKGFHILNSSKGKEYNINYIAKKIIKLLNSKSKIIHIKVPAKLKEFQVEKRCGNSNNLRKLIKYKPSTDFEKGLKKTILSELS